MKVAIVGSRTYKNLDKVIEYVRKLPKDTIVVSGGARGVDITAENAALAFGLKVQVFKPEWDKHGKAAAFIRNEDIIRNADIVVAFWDQSSRGTKHSIDLAKLLKKQLYVFLDN